MGSRGPRKARKTAYAKLREQLREETKQWAGSDGIGSENAIYRASWQLPYRAKATPTIILSIEREAEVSNKADAVATKQKKVKTGGGRRYTVSSRELGVERG